MAWTYESDFQFCQPHQACAPRAHRSAIRALLRLKPFLRPSRHAAGSPGDHGAEQGSLKGLPTSEAEMVLDTHEVTYGIKNRPPVCWQMLK